ncbi:glycosyltransferase family A protein [Bradyrhizobium sp. 164]|uniref:glycosyltransferase family 2 protein n=1 Tax=Bradyrhizobium sp. 164 TaxID=2782637 RepID=UPI001FF88D50|nr:glycosyltransferase family A protein [Bradyrhizobium sp. 164]MCK1597308.1 glycosyltransferase family 2 protein [Bradyrhizobium sp. 164]
MRASSEIEKSAEPANLRRSGVKDIMPGPDRIAPTPGTDPLVTIAIPTFNRAAWLQDCVRLALAQSYPRFEVLVSDNASTDETALVLSQFKDERLRVVHQPNNIGATENWNVCVAQARGEYIVFVPDDDRIAPWLLERCIAVIRGEPQVPIVMALGEARVVASGRTLPPQASRNLKTGIWDGVDILDEYLERRITVQGCTTMLRTETLRVWGGFPGGWPFASDLARHLPLLLEGKAGFINECCGCYSLHNATQTSRLALENHLDDVHKLVDLITHTAEERIKDEQRRRGLQLRANRFLAREAVGIIISYRKRGAELSELRPILWNWRRHFISLRGRDIFSATTLIGWLLLPAPLIGWLRNIKRKLM